MRGSGLSIAGSRSEGAPLLATNEKGFLGGSVAEVPVSLIQPCTVVPLDGPDPMEEKISVGRSRLFTPFFAFFAGWCTQEGYSPNDTDDMGNTATHLAAANGHEVRPAPQSGLRRSRSSDRIVCRTPGFVPIVQRPLCRPYPTPTSIRWECHKMRQSLRPRTYNNSSRNQVSAHSQKK